jgi:transposase
MPQPNDLSRSLVALDQNSTIIAVVEMSQSSWLVAGMLPGFERQPRQKLEPSPERLLALLHRWQDEAVRAGCTITRIAVAFEAGRDGFWLARWLEARGVGDAPRSSRASRSAHYGPVRESDRQWARLAAICVGSQGSSNIP